MSIKHLYIDAREAYNLKKTGKGQWSKAFIDECVTRDVQVTLLVTNEAVVPSGKYTVRRFASGLRFHWQVAKFCRLHPPVAYIAPTSFIVPVLLGKRFSSISKVIVHDLIAFQAGKHDSKARFIEKLLFPRVLRIVDQLFCVSIATKDEILARFPSLTAEIIPIFAGPMKREAHLPRDPQNFLLCAGTLCPRKNQLRLVQAFNKLPAPLQAKHPLVLVGGRGWADEQIVALSAASAHITWRGYVSDEQYSELLRTCLALVYPSEYEGFGLQVLDALSQGVPVLTSQGGSLQELVGSAGLIVDPFSVASIETGLEQLITDNRLRASLSHMGPIQAKTFTWSKTVDRLLAEV